MYDLTHYIIILLQGAQGSPGNSGSPGEPGPTGASGPPGDNGLQGPKGQVVSNEILPPPPPISF